MAVPTTLVIDATQQTLEITNSRDATALRGYSIEAGPPTDGEGLFFQASSSEYVFRTVDESIDDRVAELIQDSAAGGLTWTYDDSAGTLTPAYVGDSTLVTTGALNSGSITSGFGNIDVGSSNIDGATITADTAFVGDVTGNADTATLASTVTVAATTDSTCSVALFESATGSLAPKSDAGLTYNAISNVLAGTFNGDLTGDVTGDVSGTAATVTGATQAAITTAANLTTVGALNAGSISTDFGTINVGSSTITGGGASFTTISGSTSLALATGATVTGIDNGSLGTSATLLATAGAIRTYVDAQVTAQDLDIISDSGNIDIDLDSESLTLAGGTGLASSASSTTVTFAIDSTVATLAGSQTLTNKTLTTPVISSISNTGTVTLPTSTDTLVGKATTDTLTNKSISGSTNTLSAIANGSLTNSTVAYGGVSLSLGGADSTPAFNLSGATAYTGDSSLVTVGALASGSIASGFTSISTSYTDAKVTSVVAGTLIDVSGTTGDVTVNTDLSELSTSTSDGDGDYFAVVDAANAQKKLTKANISIAGFNTAVATSITGVGTLTAGTWTADVITGAYIDATSSPLANTKIWIGSSGDVAAEFALSGDATMTAGGAVTVSTAAACSGNAATATLASTVTVADSSDTTAFPAFFDSATGSLAIMTDASNLTYNASTGVLTATGFAGPLTGNVTGNASGTAATVTGAAQSAITSLGTLTGLTVNGATVFNEGSGDYDFRIEANGEANMFFVDAGNDKIGIGTTTPAGRLEIYMDSSGASPNSAADEFVIETLTSGGISILTGTSAAGGIYFGDSDDNGRGKLYYDHNTDKMNVAAGGSIALTLDSSQDVNIPNGALAIGTTLSPAAHLEIAAADNAPTIKFSESDSANKMFIGYGINGDTGELTVVADKPLNFKNGGGTRMSIAIGGAVSVNGAFSKGSGSFRIDHPLPDKKDTHHLVHSFIEGPKADLVYRGTADLSGGWAQVDLDDAAGMTEGTWELLCRDPQCWIQNDSGWDAVRGSVEGNTLTIECEETDSDDTVSWMVVAERCDPHIMETDWTDDDGHVIVEPEKPEEE